MNKFDEIQDGEATQKLNRSGSRDEGIIASTLRSLSCLLWSVKNPITGQIVLHEKMCMNGEKEIRIGLIVYFGMILCMWEGKGKAAEFNKTTFLQDKSKCNNVGGKVFNRTAQLSQITCTKGNILW